MRICKNLQLAVSKYPSYLSYAPKYHQAPVMAYDDACLVMQCTVVARRPKSQYRFNTDSMKSTSVTGSLSRGNGCAIAQFIFGKLIIRAAEDLMKLGFEGGWTENISAMQEDAVFVEMKPSIF